MKSTPAVALRAKPLGGEENEKVKKKQQQKTAKAASVPFSAFKCY